MNRLIELGVLPIINENDPVSTAEIAVGDNDTLAAIVAMEARADLLMLLSDIEGLYTADPHKDLSAKLISEVREMTDEIRALGGGAGSSLGTGGMFTKLRAASMCMERGIDMVIIRGDRPALLYDVVEGHSVGTRFFGGRK